MEFTTHNGTNFDFAKINGSHLQGYVTADYKHITKVFGKSSNHFDNYKCDAEWLIEFKDGTIATLYNYKNGRNYLGKEGLPKTQITEWNIGGFDQKAVERIKEALAA